MCKCLACELLIKPLIDMGFTISDDNYHDDIRRAVAQCKLIKLEAWTWQ